VALAFAAGTASAASSVPAKPHQGTSEFSAALNVCAFAVATAQVHTGNRCLSTTGTSDVPDAARGAGALESQLPEHLYHYTSKETAALIESSALGQAGRTLYLTPSGGLSPILADTVIPLPHEIASSV